MNHNDHVFLLEKAIIEHGGVWADLGSGTGAFTLALRDLGGHEITIYSVDKNESSLHIQKKIFNEHFPHSNMYYYAQDFTNELKLPKLDGIIMANSLHFVKDKKHILRQVNSYLKPRGLFILVEYNVDSGNDWVPYPISFNTFEKTVIHLGFSKPTLLQTIPSDFLHEIYSASTKKLW